MIQISSVTTISMMTKFIRIWLQSTQHRDILAEFELYINRKKSTLWQDVCVLYVVRAKSAMVHLHLTLAVDSLMLTTHPG